MEISPGTGWHRNVHLLYIAKLSTCTRNSFHQFLVQFLALLMVQYAQRTYTVALLSLSLESWHYTSIWWQGLSQKSQFFLHFVDLHHVMILGKWPTLCTNFFYVFISTYNSLHVSSTSCSSGETNCINTAYGNSHSMLVAEMCEGWKKTSSLHTSRPPT